MFKWIREEEERRELTQHLTVDELKNCVFALEERSNEGNFDMDSGIRNVYNRQGKLYKIELAVRVFEYVGGVDERRN